MVSVFFHYKEHDGVEWQNEEQMFTRVPVVGEYVTRAWNGALYRVYAVIHCPSNQTGYQAEVFTYPAPESQSDLIGAMAPLSVQAPPEKFDSSKWVRLGS